MTWWNDADKGKLKEEERKLSQRHNGRHKLHIDWPGSNWWTRDETSAINHLSHGTAPCYLFL